MNERNVEGGESAGGCGDEVQVGMCRFAFSATRTLIVPPTPSQKILWSRRELSTTTPARHTAGNEDSIGTNSIAIRIWDDTTGTSRHRAFFREEVDFVRGARPMPESSQNGGLNGLNLLPRGGG